MMRCVVYVSVLLTVATARPHNAELSMDTFLLQLQSNGSNVSMQPSLNLDLLTLLRFVARQELQDEVVKLKLEGERREQNLTREVEEHSKALIELEKSRLFTEKLLQPLPTSSLNLVTLGGKKYYFSTKQTFAWIEASWFCRLYGMELASVETKEEDDLILNHLSSLGMTDKCALTSGNNINSNSWFWLNGTPMFYTNWARNQPSSPETQHCMCYYRGGWHNHFCGQSSPVWNFICEEM